MALFTGGHDWLADPVDVADLLPKLQHTVKVEFPQELKQLQPPGLSFPFLTSRQYHVNLGIFFSIILLEVITTIGMCWYVRVDSMRTL